MRPFIKNLVAFIIITRISLLVFPWITNTLLQPESNPLPLSNFVQTSWNRWDAPHYLHIANYGYTNIGDEANFIVFLPLYPLVLKFTNFLFGNLVWTAIFISTFFFTLGCVIFYRLLKLTLPVGTAKRAVFFLVIFPTSFFFLAPYAESLFFYALVASFYFSFRKKWLPSGILAAVATLTRPFGILIAPSIFFDWLQSKKKKPIQLLFIFLPTLVSILIYLFINQSVYQDAFMFKKVLAQNWHKYPAFPVDGILSSWRIALLGSFNNSTIMQGWAEAISTTLALVLIPIAFLKLRRSWAVYYLLGILFLSSTNFILSTPRYLLSLPPFFILLGLASKNFLFRVSWGFVSLALLFYLTLVYTSGQWAF